MTPISDIKDLKGKRVLVVGLARSGVSLVHFLCESGAQVTVSDHKSKAELSPALELIEGLNVQFDLGGHTPKTFLNQDLIILSPGVPPNLKIFDYARSHGVQVTGEFEFATWFIREPIIAVTGTNGKSTTCKLIEAFLKESGVNCWLGGNYGDPLVEYLRKQKPLPAPEAPAQAGSTPESAQTSAPAEVGLEAAGAAPGMSMSEPSPFGTQEVSGAPVSAQVTSGVEASATAAVPESTQGETQGGTDLQGRFKVVIAEVSSFQLEHCERFTPQNIIFMNLAENHLDRYRSMEDYVNAKRRIFQNTNQATTSILNADDNAVVELARDPAVQRGRIFYFSRKPQLEPQIMTIGGAVCIKDEIRVRTGPDIEYYTVKKMKMRGRHSIDNIMAATLAAREHGAKQEAIQKVIEEFPGMSHRLEYVRRVGGVEFYNDSKATNVHAVMRALDAFDENVILIMGGKDTNLSYEALRESVRRKVKNLILVGEAKERINRDIGDDSETFLIGTFEEAVLIAYQKSRIGDTVLLSPGASSFDMFDSYEERGNYFKEIVQRFR